MKMQRTSLYIINFIVLMLFSTASFSQEDTTETPETTKDSVVGSSKYGLRLGGDLSKLVR